MNISRFKGFYQDLEAKLPKIWCDSFYDYSIENAIEVARTNLKGRIECSLQEVNFLLLVPIVNWETIFIENFSTLGTCNHCNINSSGFFDSTEAWEIYKSKNTKKIYDFYQKNYDATKLNLVFMYLSEFHFDIHLVEKLKNINTLIVNFNWDDTLHYKRVHKGQSVGLSKLAKTVDFNLTLSKSALTRYVSDGSSVFYWNGLDRAVDLESKVTPPEVNRVLFYGSRYGYRGDLIDYLKNRGIPIDVYGDGWGTEFIGYDELFSKIPAYALNLGISTIAYSKSLCCFKGRDLEVPFYGGLYLVNNHPEITSVYEADVEVLTYDDKADCYDQIVRVLQGPREFDSIKAAGKKKALSLSWGSRVRYLIRTVDIIIGSNLS